MKKVMYLLLLGFFVQCFSTDIGVGELFDSLMGKYTNPYYKKCVNNYYENMWFHDAYYAYYFTRSLFEKYSIETNWQKKNLKVPKIIHQIWLGGDVPEKYLAWMASWTKYNPDWTYILWTDEDINYLNLVNKNLFDKSSNYGEKSDILRVELINMFGGLYVDTDYECLKSFDCFNYCNSFYASTLGLAGHGVGLNNALIGASRGHFLVKKCVDNFKGCSKIHEMSNRTGPIYFTQIFFYYAHQGESNMTVYPPCYFTPDPKEAVKDARSYAIHWFDASWARSLKEEKRMPRDTRIEKSLTPLYFAKNDFRLNKQSDILTELIQELNVQTIVELGACEFLVNKLDRTINYTALSPIKFLVLEYRLRYSDEHRKYFWKDWLQEPVPPSDLLIVGDVMEYLPYDDCMTLLQHIEESNAQSVLIAHDADAKNHNTLLGERRALSMTQKPFKLLQPDRIIEIGNKTYGLWQINNQ